MNNIKALRERMGLSQCAFASAIGISQQAVAGWEAGDADPTWARAPKIADLFGCTIDALYGRELPGDPPSEAAS